ncbi:MAG: 8-oxo-dGTP diphosphatase MutT [Gammaproteobacteria bacterium]|nr:8-oxo-dGTP diphosphatase MutT [Gammaproteobacteria bacterium]
MNAQIEVAAGVIEDAAGRVLIAQRQPGKHAAGFWEFPGGKLQPGELPVEALRRELHEELGIELGSARTLIDYQHDYPDRRVHLHIFCVTAYTGEPRSRERQALKWVAVDDLLAAGLLPADAPVVDALRVNKSADRIPRRR